MAATDELLDADEIQGNILAGFNKDHQAFLFLRLPPEAVGLAEVRAWLRRLAPQVNTLAEVGRFNDLYRALRKRLGGEPQGLVATWLNVAFSAPALRRLTSPADVAEFADQFFKDGLQARSDGLGDPTDATAAGHRQNWVVGGPGNEADVLIVVASDSPALSADRVSRVGADLPTQVVILWEQPGETLPRPLTGHEHFGFKDGVSQPGVRGLLRSEPPEYLTPRPIDPGPSPQADPTTPEFAAPGRPLVWPGQFVFGYFRQSRDDPRNPPASNGTADNCPAWGRNGSFLVLRRLRQDVPAFRAFVRTAAASLAAQPGFGGLTATRFASLCVGRWPNGAPIMRSPATQNTQLGDDAHADNFFQYAADSPPPMPLRPDVGYAGDAFATSKRDDKGITCPFSAHIRKVNPRDTVTEQGNTSDVLTRLVLRRGIPYGPPASGTLESDDPKSPDGDAVDRGLIFVSYQTSIEDQFVFLQASWANHPTRPNDVGGEDPIIGQGDRTAGGQRTFKVRAAGQSAQTVPVPTDWVIPTGGGFFFSPSVSAIAQVLGKESA